MDSLRIIPLGAGQEVGRSCIILQYKGMTVMFDCGVHPAYSGRGALPYFDCIDVTTINLVLISHFHLDHCGALPYFLRRLDFRGKVYMTHPTKAIYKLVLGDYVKVSNASQEEKLYNQQDLEWSMDQIQLIDYHQSLQYLDIKFTAYNAGHVIGAAMFLVEIDGVKVLYTGDYSREPERHLQRAEVPDTLIDVLIVESTYGVQCHEDRGAREARFCNEVYKIVTRGGRCLIPVFALGRAQELLLILEEFWQIHPELASIPIYYASSLANKCMTVFQTYINMMGDRVRRLFDQGTNPFIFKHIQNLKNLDF